MKNLIMVVIRIDLPWHHLESWSCPCQGMTSSHSTGRWLPCGSSSHTRCPAQGMNCSAECQNNAIISLNIVKGNLSTYHDTRI